MENKKNYRLKLRSLMIMNMVFWYLIFISHAHYDIETKGGNLQDCVGINFCAILYLIFFFDDFDKMATYGTTLYTRI